jgi:hypothetical protein
VKLKEKLINWYEKNERKADLGFFMGGFLFDIITLSDIDDTLGLLQQLLYLMITAFILHYEFLVKYRFKILSQKMEAYWVYRRPVFHFFLGSLLSVYSLFFLKSSSIFSTFIFVILLLVIMVANEFKSVQEREVNTKVSLHVLCLFCFLSIVYPIILGFVGLFPFFLSVTTVAVIMIGIAHHLKKKKPDLKTLNGQFLIPGFSVLGLVVLCYLMGWMPPVPVSIKSMGVYHRIEKEGSKYALYHQKPKWKFWQTGDQDFIAVPGDKVYFFARIYSPAKFNDSVFLHWYFKDSKRGWQSTDRLPLTIVGGRKEGFRGFTVKQNYKAGDWRVSVETTDSREIGRLYFNIATFDIPPQDRQFQKELQ